MSDDKKNNNKPSTKKEKAKFNRSARQKESIDMYAPSDLRKEGWKTATESGALEPDHETMEMLKDYAESVAENIMREAYSPDTNPHDKVREAQYNKLLKDRDKEEQKTAYSRKELYKRKDASAQVLLTPYPAKMSFTERVTATGIFGLSIAPVFHDLVFSTMHDNILNWTTSIIAGGISGLFITDSISTVEDGERSISNILGLCAGVVLTAGFSAFRLVGLENESGYLMAGALFGIEFGTILYLESKAFATRRKFAKAESSHIEKDKLDAITEAAQTDVNYHENMLADIETDIADHQSYLEDRQVRHNSIEELKRMAVKAILEGYRSGINHNRGKIYGNSNNNNEED